MKSNWRDRVAVEHTLSTKSDRTYFDLLRVVLDHNVNTEPYRNRLLGILRNRDLKALLDEADSLAGTEYPSADLHFSANQVAALIKKYPFPSLIPGVDPEKEAMKKFLASERMCGRYNLIYTLERKLKRYRSSFLREEIRVWIRRIIGEKPDLPAIYSKCDFGPGASVGISGNATHLARKFLEPSWSVTPTALPYALAALRQIPLCWELLLKREDSSFYSHDPELFAQALAGRAAMVDYNKITLVPKTAKVHRTIAVEPLLNGFVQKGVGEYITQRLFRFGIDLTDQSRNQELARLGSIPGDDPYATIDLASASDSISIAVAKDLLPPDWFALLNAIRSPRYKTKDGIFSYQKFCSMGNGFCFPLETLIFTSVCAAVYDRHNHKADYSVYGDDIIVRASLAREVLSTLHLLGFRHNPDKTFIEGPFRESCGADWYNGEDVRPLTLDYEVDSLASYFKLHNASLRNSRTTAFFSEAREKLRDSIPHRWRFCRPWKGNADTAFEVEKDVFMASKFCNWNRRTWSWSWKELVPLAVSDDDFRERNGWSTVLLMAALRGSDSEAPFTRRRNTRTRVRVVSHHGGYSTWLPSPNGM